MATQMKKTNKTRLNLTISGEAVKAGKTLSKRENRSFSNWLEVLIVREKQKASA